jgi:8-oxo-dGTP pyrophosphatase MutT (NUDIX family)
MHRICGCLTKIQRHQGKDHATYMGSRIFWPDSDPHVYFVRIVESPLMSAPPNEIHGGTRSLYSAEEFAARALARGYPLEKAAWMAQQPLSYGIDAGIRVDETGQTNETLRLEHLVAGGAWKMASVLVPVIAREPEATVLLTLRTSHLNSHSGQIAFPGGKIEAIDPTPVDTAIREAHEETGIAPELVTPLGLLDLHNTGTGFRMIPVLAVIDPSASPVPHPGEVAEIFEVPLSFLMNEENHMRKLRAWKDWQVLFYVMEYEKRYIWGATAAILRNLYERLYAPDLE